MIPKRFALRRRMFAKKGGGGGVAALSISYSGEWTDHGMVAMTGGEYRLLEFRSSGTLSIAKPVNCEVCVVGGGADGSSGSKTEGQAGVGGAGSYLKNASLTAYSGGGVIIGAAKGASSIGGIVANGAASKDGGTGAGGADIQAAGKGDGISKYPFGDSAYEQWQDKPHCGGGSGGVLEYVPEDEYYFGGEGGTNGGDGKAAAESTKSITRATPGGKYGGGSGSKGKGSAASYYGSGGGGGTYYVRSSSSETAAAGGSGYQGIVYLRIEKTQPEE